MPTNEALTERPDGVYVARVTRIFGDPAVPSVTSGTQSRWGLILAGGEGTRLRPLTRQLAGDDRPKQFCRVIGNETLLEQTRRRVGAFAPPGRVLVVVVRAHDRFYTPLLADAPSHCVVIQPENRGTAPAILYGLLRLTTMAPAAPVAILPSDHYVSNDAAFMAHVEGAAQAVLARSDLIVLLGVPPDTAEVEYGWIELGGPLGDSGRWTLYRLFDFWEKPSPALARTLQARGCLWNSFVVVAYPSTLIALFQRTLPSLVDDFLRVGPGLTSPPDSARVGQLYAGLPSLDFSQTVLATRPPNLAILPLEGVAWCDLGAPRRAMGIRARLGADRAATFPKDAVSV